MARHPLAQRLADAVAGDPGERALEFAGRWHTWSELAAAVDRIDTVVGLVVGTAAEPAAVGVLVRNTPVHVAMLLALLRSERCLVIINPAGGQDSLRANVEALGLPLVLGAPGDLDPLSALDGVTAAAGLADLYAVPEIRPASRPTAQYPRHPGVAVRMLTSGTTGPAKRIDLPYDALYRSIVGAKDHYESGKAGTATRPRGVAIVNSPLAHLGGVFRILQCLLDQRPFVLLPRFEVQQWLRAVRMYRPKTASLVPAALRMVLEASPDPADLASLRAVTSGTAPLSADDADAFLDRFGVPVLTSYAATEFAGGVAGWTLADHREFWKDKRGSVGRAQPGCALRVVDERTGAELPPDGEGLLEVKPAQLGTDVEWVRTNDLARIDPDGFVYILGRADGAIIRGGFKVLPDRVRGAIERDSDVRSAVVLGQPDTRLGAVPVALVELPAPRGRDRRRGDQAPPRDVACGL